MRWLVVLAALFVLTVQTAHAQLPRELRSAGISEAQWRLAQETIQREARLRGQREGVIQTLAIEIFQAQPGQPFETYVALIETGAERLPIALAAAQALDPGGDPLLRRLKDRAVRAARQGRLQEALQAQDEYAAALQAAITRMTERPQLELAAAHAAAADTASALADFLGAASRYDLAANAVPESQPLVRWRYRMAQALTLQERGILFSDVTASMDAVHVLQNRALPLVPRDTHFAEYAQTLIAAVQPVLDLARLDAHRGYYELVDVYRPFEALMEGLDSVTYPRITADAQIQMARLSTLMTEIGASDFFGDDRGLLWEVERAGVYTREAEPERWADIQAYLGDASLVWAQRVGEGSSSAAPLYNAALTVYTRERTPRQWAALQEKLAVALWVFNGDVAASMAAFDAALSVRDREVLPGAWAQTQMSRGSILIEAARRGDTNAASGSIEAYQNALTIYAAQRSTAPSRWGQAMTGLGEAFTIRGGVGDLDQAEQAITAVTEWEFTDELTDAKAQFALARLRSAQGRTAEARGLARSALEIFESSVSYSDREAAQRFLESLPN